MTDGRKDGREGGRKERSKQCFNNLHLLPGLLVMGPTVSQGFIFGLFAFPLPAFPKAQPLFEDYLISISISISPHNSSPICSFSCQRPQTKTGKKLKSISKFSKLLAPKSTPNLFLPLCCHHQPQHSYFIVLCLV